MSKICDCGDSEKAYLIINPDSPDRKEILSLNPPICYEQKQNALKINNEIVAFNKEISSFNPQQQPQGGLILETPAGFSGTVPVGERWSVVRVDNAWGTQGEFFYEAGAIFNLIRPHTPGVQIGNVQINPTGQQRTLIIETLNGFSGTVPQGEEWAVVRTDSMWGSPGESPYGAGTIFQNIRPHIPGVQIGSVYVNGGWQNYHYLRKYLGTTSLNSENFHYLRKYSLGDGECILTINFADSTTQQLTFPECPTVELLSGLEISDNTGILHNFAPYNNEPFEINCGDRQCPPETCCNPCEGSALNCCYDENGKLIDSFIRRT